MTDQTQARLTGKRRGLLVAIVALAALGIGISIFVQRMWFPTPLADGQWRARGGKKAWMRVEGDAVFIGRLNDAVPHTELPNKPNGRRIFEKNDLGKAHPQRLSVQKDGSVEWIREASGPSPEYRTVFEPTSPENSKFPGGKKGGRP